MQSAAPEMPDHVRVLSCTQWQFGIVGWPEGQTNKAVHPPYPNGRLFSFTEWDCREGQGLSKPLAVLIAVKKARSPELLVGELHCSFAI